MCSWGVTMTPNFIRLLVCIVSRVWGRNWRPKSSKKFSSYTKLIEGLLTGLGNCPLSYGSSPQHNVPTVCLKNLLPPCLLPQWTERPHSSVYRCHWALNKLVYENIVDCEVYWISLWFSFWICGFWKRLGWVPVCTFTSRACFKWKTNPRPGQY